MRGRDILFEKMKKKAKSSIMCGVTGTLLCGLFSVFTIVEKWNIFYTIVFVISFLGSIYLIINGIVILKDPSKDSIFKKNPDVLRMADELYANIQYQDNYIVVSDRLFSPKNEPWNVFPLDEVYWVYISKTSTNGIPTDKELMFVTSSSRFSINVYGKRKEDIEKSINVLSQVCPKIRIGYSPENMAYADAMQKEWKQRHSGR